MGSFSLRENTEHTAKIPKIRKASVVVSPQNWVEDLPTLGPKMIPAVVFKGYIKEVRWRDRKAHIYFRGIFSHRLESAVCFLKPPLLAFIIKLLFLLVPKSGSPRWEGGSVLSCLHFHCNFLRFTDDHLKAWTGWHWVPSRGMELVKVNEATGISQYWWFSDLKERECFCLTPDIFIYLVLDRALDIICMCVAGLPFSVSLF